MDNRSHPLWLVHNVVVHPLLEITYRLRNIPIVGKYLEKFGNWAHDASLPKVKQ